MAQTVLLSAQAPTAGCTAVHSPQQRVRGNLFAHPCNDALSGRSSVFLGGSRSFRPVPSASLRTQAHARQALTIQAGLLDRFARVIRSYFSFYGNSALGDLEDPRKILDQAVTEMQADLIKLRQASAQIFATQRMMEAKERQAKSEADEWYRRAEFAVKRGEDDLARQALQRHKAIATTAANLERQLAQHTKAADTLRNNIRLMESKLSEAQSKKETLKARAASAQATVQLNQSINGLVNGLQSAGKDGLAAFNRMEEKVMAMEAEAEAAGQLLGNDDLEARFGLLEGAGGIEDDLIKLKTDMMAGGRGKALTSGQSTGYAFQMIFEREQ